LLKGSADRAGLVEVGRALRPGLVRGGQSLVVPAVVMATEGAVVDVLMILAFVIVIVVCLWLINRALKSKDD
jgi:hypothetical protein